MICDNFSILNCAMVMASTVCLGAAKSEEKEEKRYDHPMHLARMEEKEDLN